MDVVPSRFLNVVLEETGEKNAKTAMDREIPRSSSSSLTISVSSAVPKPGYFRREEASGKYSTESNLAREIDYLDLKRRLPRTVLEECIVELASPKKACDSVPEHEKDTVIIEPMYVKKPREWSINEDNNNVDMRDIFNQVEVVYSDDEESSMVENATVKNSWILGGPVERLNALPFACKYCPNTYPNKGALWQHSVATHSVEKSCQCRLCGRKFYRNCSLALHMKCHSDEQNCRCKVCGKEFNRLSLLERHSKNHHAESSVTGGGGGGGVAAVATDATVTVAFACKLCRKNFNDEATLKAHTLSHGEKFTCEQCNVTFSTKQLLDLHFYITHRRSGTPFACKVCKARFANLLELDEHSLSHTFEKSRMACHHCGEMFTQRCAYKKHLQLHTSEKLSCTICRIDFTQRSSLLRHYKRLHSLNDIPNTSTEVESPNLIATK